MSGYSVAGALGGYGYDEYNAPGFYDSEKNFTKRPIKQKPRSFRDRVDAKKRELRSRVPPSKPIEREEEPCECIECAPHLYRSHAPESKKSEKSKNSEEKECGEDCSCGGKKRGLLNQMTQQDCFILFIIIIISIVLYCMYCTMCRLNQLVQKMGGTDYNQSNPNL